MVLRPPSLLQLSPLPDLRPLPDAHPCNAPPPGAAPLPGAAAALSPAAAAPPVAPAAPDAPDAAPPPDPCLSEELPRLQSQPRKNLAARPGSPKAPQNHPRTSRRGPPRPPAGRTDPQAGLRPRCL
ncbi:unnamed protein product [Closterium sp. NIES-54]